MKPYYLMAQLPSLDLASDTAPLPITEEMFYELCDRFLDGNATSVLNKLTLIPKADNCATGNPLVDTWNKAECELRLALAEIRAEKLNKPFSKRAIPYPAPIMQAVREAVEMTDPMKAELCLNRYRLEFLETLRPFDGFSLDFVYYYGLKLKLLARIRNFDTANGEKKYKKIYDSITNGDYRENTN